MNPLARRAIITTLVILAVGGIVFLSARGGGAGMGTGAGTGVAPPPATTPPNASAAPAGTTGSSAAPGAATPPAATGASSTAPPPGAATAASPAGAPGTSTPSVGAAPPAGPPPDASGYSTIYKARPASGAVRAGTVDLAPLGSLDPAKDRFRLRFHGTGAGIADIVFSEFWKTASDRIAFEAHERAVRAGRANPPPMPPESERYVLNTLQRFGASPVPLLAAIDVTIDDQTVKLLDDVWAETARGAFVTEIAGVEGGAPVLRIERRFEFAGPIDGFGAGYDLRLTHRFENLTDREMVVRFSQCAPGDLSLESQGVMDTRRFQFGYLYSAARDPSRQSVIVHGATEDRATVLGRIEQQKHLLWPTAEQREAGYELSWYGSTNRYFSMAIHAPYALPGQPSKSLAPAVAEVLVDASPPDSTGTIIGTIRSPALPVAARSSVLMEVGVFAGPLDPRVLDAVEPYEGLRLGGLILYAMSLSGPCACCTFAWLAKVIVILLMFLHDYVVFDWGLAIIVLVVLVRFMLHPLTKASQVNMQRFAKGMQELKPQLDAIQKRFADDPARLREEQMRLYRERGVNPVGCLGGILPTFVQMPIWLALYAVLYFAFSLRQQPAFFGVFQLFGGWGFLGDLSAQDHFIKFPWSVNLWLFHVDGINLVPILMGIVFFISQKYMTPPTTVKMTPEQEAQQKMMKWMMVIIFPIGLYNMPSGLTLYILTSTAVGIFEGRAIRKQIERMDLRPKAAEPKKKRDLLGRMYADALERSRQKQKGPPKKYKER